MGYETFLNAQAAGQRRYAAGREMAEQERQRNALTSAAQSYAGGDIEGARNALAGAGNLDAVMQIDNRTARADQEYRDQRLAEEQRLQAARQRQQATLVAGAQGLRRLPAEQRWQAYQTRVLPMLRREGMDDAMLAQITEQVMDDRSLDSVITMGGGEVEQPRYLQGSRGALDVIDPYTGELTTVRQPERESAPSGFRWKADGTGVEPIPGYVEGRSAVSSATRAPPRGRSSGARSSGSSRPAPTRTYSPSEIQWR